MFKIDYVDIDDFDGEIMMIMSVSDDLWEVVLIKVDVDV